MLKLPKKIVEKLVKIPGDVYCVGGAVRDHFLQKSTNDYDFEVFNIPAWNLVQAVQDCFPDVEITGNDFSVLTANFEGYELQFSLPRTERKTGQGYKGFEISVDPYMSLHDAALRRDLTINAIYYNVKTGEFSDPVGGISDLHARLLYPVSERFKEDPIRIFRVAYFAMQDENYTISNQLYQYAAELLPELKTIHPDKLRQIFIKMAAKAVKPSNGLNFLLQTHWLDSIYGVPAMQSIPQNPIWHPEGNVWEHTMQVMDYYFNNPVLLAYEKIDGFFATLLHDVGKVWTTKIHEKDGKIHAYGHEAKSAEVCEQVLQSIDPNFNRDIIRRVQELCLFHMYLHQKATLKSVRKVRFTLENSFWTLLYLCKADQLSRKSRLGVRPKDYENSQQNLLMWEQIYREVQYEQLLITGNDLIDAGLKPGPEFKKKLNQALNWQCSGYLNSENKQKRIKELIK